MIELDTADTTEQLANTLKRFDLVTWNFDDVATEVTPEAAQELLELNINNRNVRPDAVTRLADDLRNGRFLRTAATIAIDTDGHILDGQHRLHACVEAGVPMQCIVISGLDPEAFTATDKGSRRSLGDTLKREGIPNFTRVAALATAAHQWDAGYRTGEVIDGGRKVSEQKILAYVMTNRDELVTAASTPLLQAAKIMPKVGDLARLVTRRVDAEDSEVFFEALRTGITDDAGLINLRESLRRDREGRSPSKGRFWQLGMILRTWNLWRSGDLASMTKPTLFVPGGAKANKLPLELQ